MSETITSRIQLSVSALMQNQLGLEPLGANPALSTITNWVSGIGAGQANQLFIDHRVLNGTTSENINVATFSGSLDAVQGTISMARIRAVVVQNLSGTVNSVLNSSGGGTIAGFPLNESGSITVGGAGAGAWTPFANGNSAAKVSIPGGGSLYAIAPGATAWAVGSSSGSLLQVANLASAGSITYNLMLIGANS